jgi:hypothetical protein
MSARALRSRIDAKCANSENRTFSKNLELWVPEHRGDMIWAALTIIQSWIDADRPSPSIAPLGRFEEWSRVVGGVLQHADIPGFLAVRPSDHVTAADRQTYAWREFVSKWWAIVGDAEVQVTKLFEIARNVENFRLGKEDTGDDGKKRALGIALAKKKDWTFEPLQLDDSNAELMPGKVKITCTATSRKVGGWKLEKVE